MESKFPYTIPCAYTNGTQPYEHHKLNAITHLIDELHDKELVLSARTIRQKSDSHIDISFAQIPHYCCGTLQQTQSDLIESGSINSANINISNACVVDIDVCGDPNLSLSSITLQDSGAAINMCIDTENPNLNTTTEHFLADVIFARSLADHANCPPPSYADATDVDALPSYHSVLGPCVCKTQIDVPKCQSKSKFTCLYAICRYSFATILFILAILFICFYCFIKFTRYY